MNSKYIEELHQALYESCKSEDYVEACIKYAERLLKENLPVIFDINHFAHLLGMEYRYLYLVSTMENDYKYKEVLIRKKRGGFREINMPCAVLKYIQRWILDNILDKMHYSDSSLGFRKGTSTVLNASRHLAKKCVLNLDIKDFFPTITKKDVFTVFKYYGYTRELSNFFAEICTLNGVLPQGAPTSPALANLKCIKLDKRLQKLSERLNVTYTRYADDITISGDYNLCKIKDIVIDIIESEGFSINNKKTRLLYSHQRQEVTGLIVNNDVLSVPKEYKREIKKEIYYCKKFGPSNHQEHTGDNHSFYKEHLYGKAYYIKMIEPELGESLLQQLDEIEWDY